jgi:hypothetical protein
VEDSEEMVRPRTQLVPHGASRALPCALLN